MKKGQFTTAGIAVLVLLPTLMLLATQLVYAVKESLPEFTAVKTFFDLTFEALVLPPLYTAAALSVVAGALSGERSFASPRICLAGLAALALICAAEWNIALRNLNWMQSTVHSYGYAASSAVTLAFLALRAGRSKAE